MVRTAQQAPKAVHLPKNNAHPFKPNYSFCCASLQPQFPLFSFITQFVSGLNHRGLQVWSWP